MSVVCINTMALSVMASAASNIVRTQKVVFNSLGQVKEQQTRQISDQAQRAQEQIQQMQNMLLTWAQQHQDAEKLHQKQISAVLEVVEHQQRQLNSADGGSLRTSKREKGPSILNQGFDRLVETEDTEMLQAEKDAEKDVDKDGGVDVVVKHLEETFGLTSCVDEMMSRIGSNETLARKLKQLYDQESPNDSVRRVGDKVASDLQKFRGSALVSASALLLGEFSVVSQRGRRTGIVRGGVCILGIVVVSIAVAAKLGAAIAGAGFGHIWKIRADNGCPVFGCWDACPCG